MSRCFPFPPPGYVRNHRPEDLVRFEEAKHKEKKHKSDKDRKKDKEKKEKDGSEKDRKRKHKDKKEKHDRKKDKEDRGKDKGKSSISEESSVAGKLEDRNGEKLHPEGHNKYSGFEDEGKCSTSFQGQNGNRHSQSILPYQATKEARFVQELDRQIIDDEKGRGSQFLPRVSDTDKRDQEATTGNSIWNPLQVLAEEKSSDGDKSFQGKKLELHGRNGEFIGKATTGTAIWNPLQVLSEEKNNGTDKSFQGKKLELHGRNGEFIGKATVQNLTQVARSENEGIPGPLEEHNDLRLEDKEKYKERGGNKQGEKDRDKKSHRKDKHKDKEKKEEKKKEKEKKKEEKKKKKEEKNKKKENEKMANLIIENVKVEPEKSKISGSNDLAGAACIKSVNLLNDVVGTDLNAGSIKNVNIENEKSEPEKSKISGRNDLAGAACIKSVNLLKDVVGTALNAGSIRNVNIENEKSEPEKSKISGGSVLAGAACNSSVNLSKDVVGTAFNEGSIRKRKDMDTNGFLHESEIRPNKVQRLDIHQSTENGRKVKTSSKSSSDKHAIHQSTENGRKVVASSKSSFDKHAVPNNVRLDHCGLLGNGIIEAKKPSPSKPNPSGTNLFSNQIAVPPKMSHPDFSNVNEAVRMPKMKDHATKASRKPPHPDTKYLSQILTVPIVGGLPEDDNQEWLFSNKGPPKKPELESGVKEELHVWSEAVHIESADVYALPYVIPY